MAQEKGFHSIAFPPIGVGWDGFNQERAKAIVLDELRKPKYPLKVGVVVFRRR